jgi:hypothetical protein
VGLGAFAAYAWVTAPTPYLLDSAELAAASFGLGIAHPPGEALALLWGKLFSLLPLGSVAFRVGLGQAAAGAVAAALVYRLTLALVAGLDEGRVLGALGRGALGLAAALGFALAPGAVMAADRPEVYALQAALSLGALACALHAARGREPRLALAGALLIGLGVTNHPLIAGLTGLGAALAALPLLARRAAFSRVRLVVLAVAALAAGLVPLVYLPVRAAALFQWPAPDAVVWGDPRTPEGLWWVLSAHTFTAKAPLVHVTAAPGTLPFVIIEEIGMPLALLVVGGAFFMLRRTATRAAGLAVLGAGAGAVAAALMAGFDPHNPDHRSYAAVAMAAAAALGAAGVAALAAGLGRRALGAALAFALLGATAVHVLPLPAAACLRRAAAADAVGGQLLASLPPRAALLTSHFESAFLAAYHRLVEGRRPDVAWSHLGFVRGPGYADRLAAARPTLAPLLSAHAHGTLDATAVSVYPGAVALEPDDHLAPALRQRLQPAGPLWRADEDAVALPLARVSAEAVAEAARDGLVRGFLAWRSYQDARLACSRGLAEVAAPPLADLAVLLPDDERARALAASCAPGR